MDKPKCGRARRAFFVSPMENNSHSGGSEIGNGYYRPRATRGVTRSFDSKWTSRVAVLSFFIYCAIIATACADPKKEQAPDQDPVQDGKSTEAAPEGGSDLPVDQTATASVNFQDADLADLAKAIQSNAATLRTVKTKLAAALRLEGENQLALTTSGSEIEDVVDEAADSLVDKAIAVNDLATRLNTFQASILVEGELKDLGAATQGVEQAMQQVAAHASNTATNGHRQTDASLAVTTARSGLDSARSQLDARLPTLTSERESLNQSAVARRQSAVTYTTTVNASNLAAAQSALQQLNALITQLRTNATSMTSDVDGLASSVVRLGETLDEFQRTMTVITDVEAGLKANQAELHAGAVEAGNVALGFASTIAQFSEKIEALRGTVASMREVLRAIETGAVQGILIEVARLEGAEAIVATLIEAESRENVRAALTEVRTILATSIQNLRSISGRVAAEIRTANQLVETQSTLLDDSTAIKDAQSRLVADLNAIIQNQLTTLASSDSLIVALGTAIRDQAAVLSAQRQIHSDQDGFVRSLRATLAAQLQLIADLEQVARALSTAIAGISVAVTDLCTFEDLNLIKQFPSRSFRLVCDIDAAGRSLALGPFSGTLDGKGKKILRLGQRASIFSNIGASAVIKNLKLMDVSFVPTGRLCGVVTVTNNGKIEDLSLSGTVDLAGVEYCGAIAFDNRGEINRASVSVVFTLSASSKYHAAVAYRNHSKISSTTLDVTWNLSRDSEYVGALAFENKGSITSGSARNRFIMGGGTGKTSYIAGLVYLNFGTVDRFEVNSLFHTNDNGASEYLGGVVFRNMPSGIMSKIAANTTFTSFAFTDYVSSFAQENHGVIQDAISTGTLNGTSMPRHYCAFRCGGGGAISRALATVDMRLVVPTSLFGPDATSPAALNSGTFFSLDLLPIGYDLQRLSTRERSIGLTTGQMRTQSSFVGFDFVNVWKMPPTGGYPQLR